MNHTGQGYVPDLGDEIIIYDDGVKIFGGVITGIDSEPTGYSVIEHTINCQDYTRLLDHRIVPNTYTNQTVDAIIQSLKDQYFPSDFTINNVDADVVIEYIGFNYKPLAQCIQMLADAINYDWYVDYDKDLHFFARESREAPFYLTDGSGNYIYNTLVIRRDNTQIRNTITVRGGEYIGSQLTTEIETNGVDSIFPLPYKFQDFGATLTGQPLDIGVDYINNPDDFDALYNFQEKILRFKDADKPSQGSTISIYGKPYLPVIIKYRDAAAINAMVSAEGGDGIYEYLIKDSSINSREGAIQRAQAEIVAYAQTLSEGEFITEVPGLRAGMTMVVQSDSRGLDETFVINKVSITQMTADSFYYKVSLITTRTKDLIEVLQKLILKSTDDIKINPNDITDTYIAQGDQGNFIDTLGTFSTHGSTYKWGPSTDTALWDQSAWS